MRKGRRRLAQAMKGKKADRAYQMSNFLCFLSESGDRLFLFFCSFLFFLCLAVYGGEEKGAPY